MTGPDKCDPNWDIRVKGTNHVSHIRPSEAQTRKPLLKTEFRTEFGRS